MKKAIVISVLKTKFSASIFGDDLEKSVKKIAELGYEGIELAIRDPKQVNVQKIIKLTDLYALEVPAIGTGQAYIEEGLSFVDPRKDIREKAVKRIKDQIEFASYFKAQVIIGLIRGRISKEMEQDQAEKWIIECLGECAGVAEKKGIYLTLEPLNRYETNFINTVAECIDFIKKIKVSNIRMLVDTFHMNIEEVSIYDSIIKAQKYLTHVHVADSNRWSPGRGHLDFVQIIKALNDIKYNQFLSAEILPFPTPDDAARLATEYLGSLI